MLITEKRRIGLLHEMATAYKQQHYFEEGICEVRALTATPLDKELFLKLKEKNERCDRQKSRAGNPC